MKTWVTSTLLTSLSKSSNDAHRRESDVGEEFPGTDSSKSPLDDDDKPDDFVETVDGPFLALKFIGKVNIFCAKNRN